MENITDDMIQNLSPWNDGIKPGDITKTVKESDVNRPIKSVQGI